MPFRGPWKCRTRKDVCRNETSRHKEEGGGFKRTHLWEGGVSCCGQDDQIHPALPLQELFCAFWGSLSPLLTQQLLDSDTKHPKDLCCMSIPPDSFLSCRDTAVYALTQNQNYWISWVGRDITKSNPCPCTGHPKNHPHPSEHCPKVNKFSDDNSSSSSLIALLKFFFFSSSSLWQRLKR